MQKFMGKLCFQEMHSFQTKNFIRQVVSLKKYEIVKDNFKEIYGIKVYRIRALKDIENRHQNIKAGDLGGYVQSERNLSQNNNCWIFDDAIVFDNANVIQNANICDHAQISDNAIIMGYATIMGHSKICDHAKIGGRALIAERAEIDENAQVWDSVCVGDHAHIFGNAVLERSVIVTGDAGICGNAELLDSNDFVTLTGFGLTHNTITFFRGKEEICVNFCGYHGISVKEFRHKIAASHNHDIELEYCAKEFEMLCDLMEYHFKKKTVND